MVKLKDLLNEDISFTIEMRQKNIQSIKSIKFIQQDIKDVKEQK